MSVVGRLWRRAPAWRFCLLSGIACTGLAAMFPPDVPARWLHPNVAGAGHDARYHAIDVSAPSGHRELLEGPVDPPPRQGSIRFAGRFLPLPSGTWRELLLSKGDQAEVPQAEILVRTTSPTARGGQTLTGLVMVTAPGPLSRAVGPVGLPGVCTTVGANPGEVAPPQPGQSPLAHECWVMAGIETAKAREGDGGQDASLHLVLSRLDALHIAVPARMLMIDYMRTDETGWMDASLMLPDGGKGRRESVLAWAARFAHPVHRGFEGPLGPADLTPAAVDDPR